MENFCKRNSAKIFSSLLLFLSNVCCGQSDNRLLINPNYIKGGTISEFVTEVSFIPLETTRESTFGFAQKIKVSKDHFAFYDVATIGIFIFYKNGKFRSKIMELPGLNKQAVRQFSSLENFALSEYSDNIYIVYSVDEKILTKKLAVFNPDGKLLYAKTLNESFDNLSPSFVFLDSATTLFPNARGKSERQLSFHTVKNFDQIIGNIVKIDPSDPFNKSWTSEYRLQASSNRGSVWNRLYDNNIYVFDKKGKPTSYKILLPASISLDQKFFTDTSIIGNSAKINEYLSDHLEKVSYMTNLLKIDNWFSFTFVRNNMSGPNDVYLFNSKKNELYSLGKVGVDSICYSIPVLSAGAIVIGSEDDYLYVSIPSSRLYNTLKNLTNKKWETNEVLNTYFKTQNSKSNPVIVRLRLKKISG